MFDAGFELGWTKGSWRGVILDLVTYDEQKSSSLPQCSILPIDTSFSAQHCGNAKQNITLFSPLDLYKFTYLQNQSAYNPPSIEENIPMIRRLLIGSIGNMQKRQKNVVTSLHIIINIKDNLDDQVPPNKNIKRQRM